jgi:hypothetical protein
VNGGAQHSKRVTRWLRIGLWAQLASSHPPSRSPGGRRPERVEAGCGPGQAECAVGLTGQRHRSNAADECLDVGYEQSWITQPLRTCPDTCRHGSGSGPQLSWHCSRLRTCWPHFWPHRLVRIFRIKPLNWSPLTESNRRPSPYHGDALPTELRGHTAGRASGSTAGWRGTARPGTGCTSQPSAPAEHTRPVLAEPNHPQQARSPDRRRGAGCYQ